MKIYSNSEINFDTGRCEQTLDTTLPIIAEKLRVIKNPWTGNKRKLIVDLFLTLNKHNIEFDSMLDLFSGSAMVSIAAKMLGKKVLTNDMMTYAYFNARTFVENNDVSLSEEDKKKLFETPKKCGTFVVERYHKDVKRFTLEEAKFLDGYYARVCDLFGNPLDGDIKSAMAIVYILHHVMESCFVGGRLNSGQVLAQLDHRLAHPRNNSSGMVFNSRSVACPVIHVEESSQKHRCFNQDALSLLLNKKPEVDMAYIDPPYGGQQSDYAAMYAFFEEYIYQKPLNELSHLNNSSKFSKAKGYYDHFVEVMDASSYIPKLVFSYNDSSWCKIEDIESTIKKFRSKVIIDQVDYEYQYRDKKGSSSEYIIVAE